MKKIKKTLKTLDKKWQNIPSSFRFVILCIATFIGIHYSITWCLMFWIVVVLVILLFLPENEVSPSKSQEQLPKPKDVDKQS